MAKAWEAPPPVDLLNWAVRNIVFGDDSPFPGPYNADLFPFFTEILKALGPDEACRIVTLAKSAQLGGTVLANIFVGGTMACAPCAMMYVHPTEDNAERWSKLKWAPMVKATDALKSIFSSKSREGGNSVLFKERKDGRGSLVITGANSPASLSMISVSRQVQDDLSKWVPNSAGSPERQADSRSRAFEFAKLFKNSTPLIDPGCAITSNFKKGTQEKYHVPCPHCDHMQPLEWDNMLANLVEDDPASAFFSCVECGCAIEEHHRADIVKRGRWVAANPAAHSEHRSFYLWSAYGPLQSWRRIHAEYYAAKGDPAAEQVFLNDTVGRAFKTEGSAPPWEAIRDRAEATGYRRSVIPTGGLVLTLGVDCQDTWVEWQLVAWGRDNRRFVVDYGEIDGHISEEKCQKPLRKLLYSKWKNAAGNLVEIDRAAIDGNAYTNDVWDFARKIPASKLIMVRGMGDEAAPRIARVKKERHHKTGKLLRYAKRFYHFAASTLKMSLYRQLPIEDPLVKGFVGFPAGLDDEYFQMLTAETRQAVRGKDGFTKYKWVKASGQRNEALDTMNQAETAATNFGVRSFAETRWQELETERESPPVSEQLDLEMDLFPSGHPAQPAAIPSETEPEPAEKPEPEKKKPKARRPRRPKKYY